jgi:hypothetical protein
MSAKSILFKTLISIQQRTKTCCLKLLLYLIFWRGGGAVLGYKCQTLCSTTSVTLPSREFNSYLSDTWMFLNSSIQKRVLFASLSRFTFVIENQRFSDKPGTLHMLSTCASTDRKISTFGTPM